MGLVADNRSHTAAVVLSFGTPPRLGVFTQIILLFSILSMSTVEPAATPFTMAFFAVLVTVASASQDIVLDAYRIESFNSKEQGAGVAVFVLGYRFGLVFPVPVPFGWLPP